MTSKTSLIALADLCESATEASRELDALIWAEIGWTEGNKKDAWHKGRPFGPENVVNGITMAVAIERYPKDLSGIARNWNVPRLTGSIDAAASAVPTKPFPELRPGTWWWMVDSIGCAGHVAYENHDSGIPEYGSEARTPALALLAAALRAHADMEEQP